MKTSLHLTLLLTLLACGLAIHAQPTTFRMNYGTLGYSQDLVENAAGNYVLAVDDLTGNYLLEMDMHGHINWADSLLGPVSWDRLFPLPSGKFYAVGTIETVPGAPKLLCGMYDANGQNLWLTTLDTTHASSNARGCLLDNGKLMVLGDENHNFFSSSIYVGVLDTTGAVMWEKNFAGKTMSGAMKLSNGHAMVIYSSNDTTTFMRLDAAGQVLWGKEYYDLNVIELTPRGDSLLYAGCVLYGWKENTGLCVFDTAGDFRWGRDFSYGHSVERLTFHPNGDILSAGSLYVDDFMVPYSMMKVMVYSPTLDTARVGFFHNMGIGGGATPALITPDNGYLVAYHSNVNIPGETGLLLTKTDFAYHTVCDSGWRDAFMPAALTYAPSLSSPVGVACGPSVSLPPLGYASKTLTINMLCDGVGVEAPKTPQLTAAPNPSSDRLRLSWPQPALHGATISLELWNANGQVVLRSVIENTGAAIISLAELARGTYWVRLVGSDQFLSLSVVKE